MENKSNMIKIVFGVIVAIGVLGALIFAIYYLFFRSEAGTDATSIEKNYQFKHYEKEKEKHKNDKEKIKELEKLTATIKDGKKNDLFDAFYNVCKDNTEEAKEFTKTAVEKDKKILLVLQEILCNAFAKTDKDAKIDMAPYERFIIDTNDEYKKLESDKKQDELKKKVSTQILDALKGYLQDGESNKLYIAYKGKDDDIQAGKKEAENKEGDKKDEKKDDEKENEKVAENEGEKPKEGEKPAEPNPSAATA